MANLVAAVLSVGGISLAAWSAGERFVELIWRFASRERKPPRHVAVSTTLGLGLIATVLFGLGLAGLLENWVLGLGLGLLVVDGARRLVRVGWPAHLEEEWSGWDCFQRFHPIAALIPVVILALYPETGFDATLYHLPFAKGFLETGELGFFSTLRFPVFPQAGELLFCLALFLGGETAAALTQALAMVLVSALILRWGRILGFPNSGVLASCLWLGTPLVLVLSTSSYVDIGLTLFATGALSSWWEWRTRQDKAWLVLAAAFASFGAATKYLGLYFVAALLVLTLATSRRGRRIGPSALAMGVVAVLTSPWYARIFWHSGNPVFPFYSRVFGESEWSSRLHYGPSGQQLSGVTDLWERVWEGLFFLLQTPWSGCCDRQVFNFQAPSTPFYLVLVPICLVALFRVRETRALVVTLLVYAVLWLTTIRDLRFLVPLFPTLNVVAFVALEKLGFTWRAAGRWLAAIALITPGLGYGLLRILEFGPLPLKPDARRAFIESRLSGSEAIFWLNDEHKTDFTVYSFGFENVRYYSEGRFFGDHFGPWSYQVIAKRLRGEGLAALADLEACYVLAGRASPIAEVLAALPLAKEGDDYLLFRVPKVPCDGS